MIVYENDGSLYCDECYDSSGTFAEIEEGTTTDSEGNVTTLFWCSVCGAEALSDELDLQPFFHIPDSYYAHQALLQRDYLPTLFFN